MRIFPEIFKWASIVFLFFLSIILVVLLGIAFFDANHYYTLHTRSLPKAQAAAQDEFVRYCKEEGLDPGSFQGPSVDILEDDPQYVFAWNRSNDEKVYVSVIYNPYYDVLPSMSDALADKRLQHERAKKLMLQKHMPQGN